MDHLLSAEAVIGEQGSFWGALNRAAMVHRIHPPLLDPLSPSFFFTTLSSSWLAAAAVLHFCLHSLFVSGPEKIRFLPGLQAVKCREGSTGLFFFLEGGLLFVCTDARGHL